MSSNQSVTEPALSKPANAKQPDIAPLSASDTKPWNDGSDNILSPGLGMIVHFWAIQTRGKSRNSLAQRYKRSPLNAFPGVKRKVLA
jgi:hypothetical protein